MSAIRTGPTRAAGTHRRAPDAAAGPRPPSPRELAADAIVHLLGLAGGLAGAVILVSLIAGRGGALEIAAILIYAGGLLAMLGCSTAYHLARRHPRRDLLQRFDHAAIFAMIAGTYTPFTVLALEGGWSLVLTTLVWSLAVAGIVLKLWQPHRLRRLSAAPYLLLGWVGVSAFFPLLGAVGPLPVGLILAGGVLYSVGVLFHAWERLPFQNAIWHGFVVSAAAVHYAAVVSGVVLKGAA